MLVKLYFGQVKYYELYKKKFSKWKKECKNKRTTKIERIMWVTKKSLWIQEYDVKKMTGMIYKLSEYI